MENFTEKVLAFQKSNQGLKELVAELSPRIYQYPRFKLGWDEDACGDFYVFFQPRLVRLISRFKDQGKPFESYLCSVLNWQLKNFSRERRYSERGWNVALRLETAEEREDECDGTEASSPDMADPRIAGLFVKDSDKRNFLLLCLKCVRSLPADQIPALSTLTGIPCRQLEDYVAALRVRAEHREKRLERFRVRRNRAYSTSRLLEAELSEEMDPRRREEIHERLAKARKRMRAAMDRMSRMMLNPTNREIAEVLGIPKGTVDSGLYWLKKKLALVYDPGSLQSA
jgi:RNA polymerase sigma factor (sigma-70 family)